ncbi:F-box protein [Tripterygium wilfordii]|uniref:F-box protein n=1 Tax=Tripterygium wilfordii TaxID=458696 RepID=A0A7J7CMZ8_TRIWF|nr:F-box protein CPR1-like [Tripterygium wilfordii]KAF5735368.1 F-box protein [Tripterygium wilfordii]
MISDFFPQEVVADILLRLPDKTLGNCLCVCKSWYTFITSPTFIAKHFNKRKNNGRRLLFRQFYASNRVCYSFHVDNSSFVKCQDLYFPLQSFRHSRVVGSCNGVLCLSESILIRTCKIFLWNPTIRKFLSLPPPPVSFSHYSTHVYDLGFGFDCLSDDYKVVVLWFPKREHGNASPSRPQVFVYSLSTNSWRNISAMALPPFKVVRFHMTQAYVNGAIHWVASGGINRLTDDELHSDFILRFNVSDERFDRMCLPKCSATNGTWKLVASSLHKQLSAARYDRDRLHFDCSIWTMKEYGVSESWTMPHMVSLGPTGRNRRWTCVLGSMGDGDLILFRDMDQLYSYEPVSGRLRHLGIYGLEGSSYLNNFTESIALLGQGKTILNENVVESLVLPSQVSKNMEEENNQSKTRKRSGRNVTGFLRKCIYLIQKGCNKQGTDQHI